MLNQAQKSAKDTDKSRFVEDANLAYGEIYAEKADNVASLATPITIGEVAAKLMSGYGYEGKIHAVTSGTVTGITPSQTTVELNVGASETISITPNSGDGTNYYVDIKGLYYLVNMTNSKISLGEGLETLPTGRSTATLGVSSSTENVTVDKDEDAMTVTITGASAGSANVTVTYGTATTDINVTVVQKYAVTVESEDTSKGTIISPSTATAQYDSGATITLEAEAEDGYTFSGWYNGETLISVENPHTYTVSGAITITGKFVADAPDATKFGNTVSLGTVTVGSAALTNGWQYFYDDGTNIYLIYADYLENGKIPSGTGISKNGYRVYLTNSTISRDYFVDYLKSTTTWSGFATGVTNALAAKSVTVTGVTATGAPTPEMWTESYNAKYNTTLGAQNFTTTGQTYYSGNGGTSTSVATSSSTTSYTGYLYTRDNTVATIKWEDYLRSDYMQTLDGWPGTSSSNMYFPHTGSSGWNSTYGYWLARFSRSKFSLY